MSIETSIGLGTGQPYPYRRTELVEPDWTRFPGWKDVTAEDWALGPVAARALREERQAAARADGRPRRRALLRRPRARPGRARHDVDARPAADDEHDGAATTSRRGPGSLTDAFYADPVRHYMLPVFSRPPYRLVLAPARHPRLAARARHVGDRGAHPPLPDQGAGRAAADLPAVLRALHPDGPRRQLHRGHRQAEVRRQAQRPARRHARLPAPHARRARRRGLRRRRGQHAVGRGSRRS